MCLRLPRATSAQCGAAIDAHGHRCAVGVRMTVHLASLAKATRFAAPHARRSELKASVNNALLDGTRVMLALLCWANRNGDRQQAGLQRHSPRNDVVCEPPPAPQTRVDRQRSSL